MLALIQAPSARSAPGPLTVSGGRAPENLFVSRTLDPTQHWAITRIPALCRTSSGTLLAFAEARQAAGDQSSNVIIMRRRPAGSSRWQVARTVAEDEPASLNNPCVLAVPGRILLMYQRYPPGVTEWTAASGPLSEQTCGTLVTVSSDDGETWSPPRDITSVVRSPKSRSDACGPGIGIQLQRGRHAGRLLFPFNEGVGTRWRVFAVYSDDGGAVWRRGKTARAPATMLPNESQFAELSNGGVLLNARDQGGSHLRLSGVSEDGGETWGQLQLCTQLPDPECMGSLLRVSFEPDVLLFCNPANRTHRRDGTLRISQDGGAAWNTLRVVAPGSFGYSCMCMLPRRRIGLLYEITQRSAAGAPGVRIVYTTVPISALLRDLRASGSRTHLK